MINPKNLLLTLFAACALSACNQSTFEKLEDRPKKLQEFFSGGLAEQSISDKDLFGYYKNAFENSQIICTKDTTVNNSYGGATTTRKFLVVRQKDTLAIVVEEERRYDSGLYGSDLDYSFVTKFSDPKGARNVEHWWYSSMSTLGMGE